MARNCKVHVGGGYSMTCYACNGIPDGARVLNVRVEPVLTGGNGLVDPSIFTDDQLRAEWERRHPQAAIEGRVGLHTARDADLRAECERRDLAVLGAHHPLADSLCAERDEWKREHELLDAEYKRWRLRMRDTLRELGCADGVDPASFLLDLKRRAEATDAAEPCMECGAKFDGVVLLAEHVRRFHRLAPDCERGPGIAAQRPDNSVAWLDEDLLCEDE